MSKAVRVLAQGHVLVIEFDDSLDLQPRLADLFSDDQHLVAKFVITREAHLCQ